MSCSIVTYQTAWPGLISETRLDALRDLLSIEGVCIGYRKDMDRIGHLRYSVYIDELGKTVASANHRTRQIRDIHDASALHLFVAAANVIVGCVRMHIGSIPNELSAPLDLWRFDPDAITNPAFVSKLVVHPRVRGTSVLRRLVRGVYLAGKIAHVQAMFCTTFPDLVPMYERMGMQTYRGMHTDPDFGPQYALVAWMQGELSTFVTNPR